MTSPTKKTISNPQPLPRNPSSTSSKVLTRILIISDTFNTPYFNKEQFDKLPNQHIDVLIHCGNLTSNGELNQYKTALKDIASIPADLKLVIAGSHDLTLDEKFWSKSEAGKERPQDHSKAIKILSNDATSRKGKVRYLMEGCHSFVLGNGARLNVYASPYTIGDGEFAFSYRKKEDRFNMAYSLRASDVKVGMKGCSRNPVPDWPAVDVMITNGPPRGILDECAGGRAGCEGLVRAVSRARPQVHCFGHVNEDVGGLLVEWDEDKTKRGTDATRWKSRQTNGWPYSYSDFSDLKFGDETLMINASIMDMEMEATNKPWLVEVSLAKAL